jgi:GDPmannose 4,6-dehydratase
LRKVYDLSKKALITGITGQDGAYLAQFLVRKGYKVFGTYRRVSTPTFWRLRYLGMADNITLIPCDLTDEGSILNAVLTADPDEVYNLAAQSFVESSFDAPTATGDVSGLGVTRVLDALRLVNHDCRFYQASSSEMYGDLAGDSQDERSPLIPASPYAAAKVYGHWLTRIYRESYKMFACSGILFNHESPIRGLEFVTRKVSNAVAMIKVGLATRVRLGNLAARRDWGYAPEYVEMMWRMLQNDKPVDYVIATGKHHAVKELVEHAFSQAGLSWEDHVEIDKELFRPLEVPSLRGISTKATKDLGWTPKTTFSDLVKIMVSTDLKRWKDALAGRVFPWDVQGFMNGMQGRKLRRK